MITPCSDSGAGRPTGRPRASWSAWAGEAHCDHVAAAGVAAAFRDDGDLRPPGFSLIVWGWNEEALEEVSDLRSLFCPGTVETRTRALARHRSQTTDMISATKAFILPPEVAMLTTRAFEIYLELP